jgi:hypothetical protein
MLFAISFLRSARKTWFSAAVVLFGLTVGCGRTQHGEANSQLAPAARTDRSQLQAGPRLILDQATLAALRESAERRTSRWNTTHARCKMQAEVPLSAGFFGFRWADALASLSLCWHATGDDKFAEAAVGYLRALLDDRFKIGDGQGGAAAIRSNSGYGIRTFGAYSALGYDWLRGAPGMTPDLRQRIIERLDAWLGWYQAEGYLRDDPVSNYFMGYFTALSFAALATHGETPSAERWRREAERLLAEKVMPAFAEELGGGSWPEGWQYGEYVAAQAALVAKGFETVLGAPMARRMPWLKQVVTHHTHALLPGDGTVYGGGTWNARPARPSALALTAIAFALDGHDEAVASQARWLVEHALPPVDKEFSWVALLSDRPNAAQRDPRQRAKKSLHMAGAGLSFMRTDWSKNAVWASLQAGPRLARDHQHNDQGHFELWRAGDGLLIDGASREGSATINHNTLLIDDGGRCMNYTPNQGAWGKNVRTRRFGDDGNVVVAVGDLAEAYAPACIQHGCRERSVHELTRSLVFVRPNLLVIDDRLVLDQAGDGAVWAAHVPQKPAQQGERGVTAVVGTSRVDVQTLLPDRSEFRLIREPAGSGDGPHRLNKPFGQLWRIEVESPRQARDRRFLHWITANPREERAAAATAIAGKRLSGARGSAGGRSVAVLFAEQPDGGSAALGAPADLVVIVGLEGGTTYGAAIEGARCRLTIRRTPSGTERASSAGVVKLSARSCGS